jgi:hypothetical protein
MQPKNSLSKMNVDVVSHIHKTYCDEIQEVPLEISDYTTESGCTPSQQIP